MKNIIYLILCFSSENPAVTHRLIPWLNRELVALMQNTEEIPRILEEMRELLGVHDIQSQEMRNYFRPHLRQQTEHFIHEFNSECEITSSSL